MMKYGWINVLVLVILQFESGMASTYYQLQGGFRSTPQSASLEAQYYYNEKLWSGSESEPVWKYGFWRLGAFAAVHGQIGIKVDVFPISIWQIQIQRSLTSRFYDTKNVNCSIVECRGMLQRGSFKTSIALGYGDYFFIPSYSVTDLIMSSGDKNFSSEEDNIVADHSGDQLVTVQWVLGIKNENQKWIFLNKDSRMVNSRDTNSSRYIIWSQSKDKEYNYFVGAGTYKSSYLKPSPSVVMGISWTVGENLSLF